MWRTRTKVAKHWGKVRLLAESWLPASLVVRGVHGTASVRCCAGCRTVQRVWEDDGRLGFGVWCVAFRSF